MNEIEADYGQVFLFPPGLDDWILPEDPARFICDFVDSLDLREAGIKVEKNMQGRPGYSDRLLLKIWIYGYFEGWTVRGLQKVKAQWSMICMSLNLKKLYKVWVNGDFQFAF